MSKKQRKYSYTAYDTVTEGGTELGKVLVIYFLSIQYKNKDCYKYVNSVLLDLQKVILLKPNNPPPPPPPPFSM